MNNSVILYNNYLAYCLIVECVVATHCTTYCHTCGWEDRVFSYSYLNVLYKVNNIHINLCCRSTVMNVSA